MRMFCNSLLLSAVTFFFPSSCFPRFAAFKCSCQEQFRTFTTTMDPLSLSASIAGLITITNAIVTGGFKYLSEFKQGDETIKNLFREVNLLFGILHSLENVAKQFESEQSSLQHTTRIHHINACDNTLRKIETQLEKVAAKRNKVTDRVSLRQRALWPLSKPETMSLLAEVERHKTSLSLALSVDEMYVDLIAAESITC